MVYKMETLRSRIFNFIYQILLRLLDPIASLIKM